MDCKKALTDADGDVEQAIELLRVKQGKRIEDRGERVASRGDDPDLRPPQREGRRDRRGRLRDRLRRPQRGLRRVRARGRVAHRRAPPRWVSRDEVPDEPRDAELRIFEQEAADKPEEIRAKIAEGKLAKWYSEVVLLDQPHVNPTSTTARRSASCAPDRRDDRRERRDPPLRAVRRRRISAWSVSNARAG